MLERLWIQEERERHFTGCFVLSFVFALLSILIAYYFIPFRVSGMNLGGIVSVLLVSLVSAIPLITYLERRESEETEMKLGGETRLLRRHWTELKTYLTFFLGVSLAFGVSNSALPQDFFSVQTTVIGSITGKTISGSLFSEVIINNLSVFFLTFLLSFALTAGMIFILVWNASILGVFITNLSKSALHLPLAALSYLPHGILEVAAYILAGISGFYLSHEFREFAERENKKEVFWMIEDSLTVLIIGLSFLILAGLLESLAI